VSAVADDEAEGAGAVDRECGIIGAGIESHASRLLWNLVMDEQKTQQSSTVQGSSPGRVRVSASGYDGCILQRMTIIDSGYHEAGSSHSIQNK